MSIVELAYDGKLKNIKFQLVLALEAAALEGHLSVVKFLVRSGVCPNGSPALAKAARRNHLKVVKYLTPKSNHFRRSQAMMSALQQGHGRVVKYLVKHVDIGPIMCGEAYGNAKLEKILGKKCKRSKSKSRSRSRSVTRKYITNIIKTIS
jgi:ankyrin repeat protein